MVRRLMTVLPDAKWLSTVGANLKRAADKALTGYLQAHGPNLSKLEHVEKVVELKLEEGIVVSGRIDLIRRTDTNEIVIVDFKSDAGFR